MQPNTAKAIEADILSSLLDDGYEYVNVKTLLNADMLLDLAGEKARADVFMIEASVPLALRHDLTIPLMQKYLEEEPHLPRKLYVTEGVVYRKRDIDDDRPKEFRQISFESLQSTDPMQEDVLCMEKAISLLAKQGLNDLKIITSDVRLLKEIMKCLNIAPQRLSRLEKALWQPSKFLALLEKYSQVTEDEKHIFAPLSSLKRDDAMIVIKDVLQLAGIPHIGKRTEEEVLDRFVINAEERLEPPIDENVRVFLNHLMHLSCPIEHTVAQIKALAKNCHITLNEKPLQYFTERLQHIKTLGLPVGSMYFTTNSRRKMEYYSGFVFEILLHGREDDMAVAGGGRYDALLDAMGANRKVRAVGCEIRPEQIAYYKSL